jgi:hypothetical protein
MLTMRHAIFPRISSVFGIVSLALALGVTACGCSGDLGGSSDTDDLGDSCSEDPDCDPTGGPVAAIAILASQIGPAGVGVDPDTLFILLGAPIPTCSELEPSLSCGGNFRISIRVPPALQKPGVIPLDSPEIVAVATVAGYEDPENPDGTCPSEDDSLVEGSIEIESIDGEEVLLRLHQVGPFSLTHPYVHPAYIARRCD